MSNNKRYPVRLTCQNRVASPSPQSAMPPLPAVSWSAIGRAAPSLLPCNSASALLPQADAVIITWTRAEWAALDQVLCETTSMPNSSQNQITRKGWTEYSTQLLPGQDPTWTFWGYYRLVQVNQAKVLLFKSNTHSRNPGIAALQAFILRIIKEVNPSFFLTIGTAGATHTSDPFGALHIGNQCTLYADSSSGKQAVTYSSCWTPDWEMVRAAVNRIIPLWNPIPITKADLVSLQEHYNAYCKTHYTLDQIYVSNMEMEVSIDLPSSS